MNNRLESVPMERPWRKNGGFVYVSGDVSIETGQDYDHFLRYHQVSVNDELYRFASRKVLKEGRHEYIILPPDIQDFGMNRTTVSVEDVIKVARRYGARLPSFTDAFVVSALLDTRDMDEMGFSGGIIVMHPSIADKYQVVLCRNVPLPGACGVTKKITLTKLTSDGKVRRHNGLGYLFRAPPAAKREINPRHLGL